MENKTDYEVFMTSLRWNYDMALAATHECCRRNLQSYLTVIVRNNPQESIAKVAWEGTNKDKLDFHECIQILIDCQHEFVLQDTWEIAKEIIPYYELPRVIACVRSMAVANDIIGYLIKEKPNGLTKSDLRWILESKFTEIVGWAGNMLEQGQFVESE